MRISCEWYTKWIYKDIKVGLLKFLPAFVSASIPAASSSPLARLTHFHTHPTKLPTYWVYPRRGFNILGIAYRINKNFLYVFVRHVERRTKFLFSHSLRGKIIGTVNVYSLTLCSTVNCRHLSTVNMLTLIKKLKLFYYLFGLCKSFFF